jgi:predicted lipid-binding transport protein (Tim44 family)
MLDPRPRSRGLLAGAVVAALTALLGAALTAPDADARRLGGAKSFGRQAPEAAPQQAQPPAREAPSAQRAQAAPSREPAPQTAARPVPDRDPGPIGRRLGPIGALAAALGITTLVSHLGLVTPLAELLTGALTIGLPVLAAMILWRMLRGPRAPRQVARRLEPEFNVAQIIGTPPSRVAGSVTAADPSNPSGFGGAPPAARAALPVAIAARPSRVPPDFDVQAFVRVAKVQFLRLQAAWDARNLADISQFTTPEILAEIRVQLDEDAGDRTEVVKVEAELLGIEEGPEDWVARVRFSGTVREHLGEPARPFQENWTLSKRKKRGAGWLLAGILHLP